MELYWYECQNKHCELVFRPHYEVSACPRCGCRELITQKEDKKKPESNEDKLR